MYNFNGKEVPPFHTLMKCSIKDYRRSLTFCLSPQISFTK